MQLQSCHQFPEEKWKEQNVNIYEKKLYYKATIVPITIKFSPLTFSQQSEPQILYEKQLGFVSGKKKHKLRIKSFFQAKTQMLDKRKISFGIEK